MAQKTLNQVLQQEEQAFIHLYKTVAEANDFEVIINRITEYHYFGRYVAQNGHYFTAVNAINSEKKNNLTIEFDDEGRFALKYQNEYLKVKFERTPESAVGMKYIECTVQPRYTKEDLCYIFTYPADPTETDCRLDGEKLPTDSPQQIDLSEALVLKRFKKLFLRTLRKDFCGLWLRTRLWAGWY